jgi:TRAP-type C4-dicarboxylate transport system permease small subunit
MSILRKVLVVLRGIEQVLMIVGLVVTVILVIVSVFARYVLGTGLLWSDEVVGFMLVLITMMGAAIGYREKMHTSLDVFFDRAQGVLKYVMKTIIGLASAFFLIALIYSGLLLVAETYGRLAFTMDINMAFVYFLIPVGAALLLLEVLLRNVSDLLIARNSKTG